MKDKYQLENILKGLANHKRITLLKIIAKNPGESLVSLSEKTSISFKTVAQHIDRLVLSGLILKKQNGNLVAINITATGSKCLDFLSKI